jgi:glycosyltransferase involved in cell wall biosynthesis
MAQFVRGSLAERQKLCYIVHDLCSDTPTHHYHLYEFLEVLAKELDLFLVVESGGVGPAFPWATRRYVQRLSPGPFRLLELLMVLAYARAIGYTHFYTHYSYFGGLAAGLVSRLSGGESNYWHCGRPADYFVRPIWKAPRTYLREEVPLRLVLWLTQYLVTGNQASAQYYQSVFGLTADRVRVVPNWVNLARFNAAGVSPAGLRNALGISEGDRTCLFVHRVSAERGADQLVPLATLVRRRDPRAVFVVVGDGPYMSSLRREIDDTHLANAFRIIGWVPNRDVAQYYAIADVFISPAIRAGFPRNLLEAMAMGVPVVATAADGLSEILTSGQQGFLVPSGQVEAFAERIVDLLQRPQVRKTLRAEARKRAGDFSLEKATQLFLAHVLGLAGKGE